MANPQDLDERERKKMECIASLIAADGRAARLVADDPTILGELGVTGRPLLHWLVVEDYPAAVTAAIKLGADIATRDEIGQTPLSLGCMLGRLGAVRVLLEHGADPNGEDAFGDPVLEVATMHTHPDIMMTLLRYGARGDYMTKSGVCIYRGLRDLDDVVRQQIEAELERRGVTRRLVYDRYRLEDVYDSMEQWLASMERRANRRDSSP